MRLGGGRYDDAIRSAAAAADRKKQVCVLARVRGDDVAAGKNDARFEDLVGAEAEVAGCGGVAAALGPASYAAYALRRVSAMGLNERCAALVQVSTYWIAAADDNHVVGRGCGVDVFPNVSSSDEEGAAGPVRLLATIRRFVSLLKRDSFTKMS